ncbi:hypothetical protein BDV06DRAFT_229607 [Aspergillus oleicola]
MNITLPGGCLNYYLPLEYLSFLVMTWRLGWLYWLVNTGFLWFSGGWYYYPNHNHVNPYHGLNTG